MPSLGMPELMIIVLLVLIVFGAGKLPDVLKSMGKGVRAFKDEVNAKDDQAQSTPTSTDPQPPVR